MQRDVSIGNVLVLKSSAKTTPFNMNKLNDFLNVYRNGGQKPNSKPQAETTIKVEELKNLMDTAELKFTQAIEKLATEAGELESIIKALGVSNICRAIISDGDLAAYIPNYFSSTHGSGMLSASMIYYAWIMFVLNSSIGHS